MKQLRLIFLIAQHPGPNKIGSGGQMEGNVDQLIFLAGKQNTQVQLASLNEATSAAAFKDLMRTLRLQEDIASDYTDLCQRELAAMLNLQLLHGDRKPVFPVAGTDVLRQYNLEGYTLQALTDTALVNPPDLQIYATGTQHFNIRP